MHKRIERGLGLLSAIAGGPCQLKWAAACVGISCSYGEQLAQALVRAFIIQGRRGPGGGYSLIGSPADIVLADAIRALEVGRPSLDGEALLGLLGDVTLAEYMVARNLVAELQQQRQAA